MYGMAGGFDSGITLTSTLRMVTDRLNLGRILLMICENSSSLYECLVKLGTTAEKRLMIDIMTLPQSYGRKEIAETRWIHGNDNPADAMTKATSKRTLSKLVRYNSITMRSPREG